MSRMSDQTPQEPGQQPADEPTAELPREPDAASAPPPAEPVTEPAPAEPATRWQDRVLGVRGVVAVATGALLLGGLGGFALGHVVDGDRGDWRQGGPAWQRGPGGHGGGPGGGWGPQRRPGQQQAPPSRQDRDSDR